MYVLAVISTDTLSHRCTDGSGIKPRYVAFGIRIIPDGVGVKTRTEDEDEDEAAGSDGA